MVDVSRKFRSSRVSLIGLVLLLALIARAYLPAMAGPLTFKAEFWDIFWYGLVGSAWVTLILALLAWELIMGSKNLAPSVNE